MLRRLEDELAKLISTKRFWVEPEFAAQRYTAIKFTRPSKLAEALGVFDSKEADARIAASQAGTIVTPTFPKRATPTRFDDGELSV
jgi:hypothetical protein